MDKTYNQKENENIYILFVLILIGLYVWAVWLVNYHLYVIIPAIILFIIKIIKISKNPETPVIKLTDTEIHLLTFNKKFKYDEISHIHINSRLSNGHLILKETTKKVIINSVSIPVENQKEIQGFVLKKLNK